ncbi:MAG: alcohol dehydrogenase catalytic domain-containing protein [Gemmatimonadota bacterium]
MRGVWLENGKARLRQDLPVPAPVAGEARVRVTLAGICNTDLELIRGYYPFTGVLGHEFVGVLEEVAPADSRAPAGERGATSTDPTAGPATDAAGNRATDAAASATGPAVQPDLVGRRVVGEINAVCHACRHCHEGRPTHCERRTVLGIVGRNGAFAEYLTLPVENLHPVPDDLPDEIAVFTEPLAAALEILEQARVGPEDRVLVVGDGKLGQLVARVLARTGCELRVVGRHERKLALLEAAGIATAVAAEDRPATPGPVEPPSPDASSAAADSGLTPGIEAGRFDLAVECTGNPAGFEIARRALRPRGTLVLKSTYAGELTLDMSSIVVDELTLVGSRCGPFPAALELLAGGEIDPRPLIDARYPLAEPEAALERAGRSGVLKVLIEMTSGAQLRRTDMAKLGTR